MKTCLFQFFLAALLMSFLFMAQTQAQADTVQTKAPLEHASAWTGALDFYQSFLSRADGHRCPMFPSCSAYAKQAFQQHGWVKGWILTCDRLLRCGRDEIHRVPGIRVNGTVHAYDPLGANTFWWKQK